MSNAAIKIQDRPVLVSTNPAKNYEPIGEVPVSTSSDIEAAVRQTRMAQPLWQALGVKGRIEAVRRLRKIFEKNADSIQSGMSREMGMSLQGAKGSYDWSLNHIDWYIDNAESCLAPEVTFENATEIHRVYYEPHGVAAVIAPWNFPISNFAMGAVQPLLAGNTVVYKVSEEVPLFGKLLDEMVADAGWPNGVFNQVYGDGSVGEKLARSDIDALHFTGSSAVGKKLYQIAAEKFIPVHLELGGSDAGIVCEDADVDGQIPSIYFSKFVNNGQICCGLKRLLVHESRFEEVVQKLAAFIRSKKVGDPQAVDTDLGPLVAKRQLDLVRAQVEEARAQGAVVVIGGKEPAALQGAFYEPTLLTNIKPGMRVWREEVFGPVLPVIAFKTDEEAIRIANDTPYGLSGYVYTQNKARVAALAAALRAGSISHNGVDYSGPHNPFGGYKLSGLKKNCGKQGFRDACQVKVVAMQK
jgi:acyl-CoA reductase-like NAD-dependent aldehyde dehydrogenase